MSENTNNPGQPTPPAASGFEAATPPPPAAAPPPSPSYAAAPPPAAPGAAGRVTNTMAIITLVAGIGGLTFLPFVGSIVAVITGPMADKQIRNTGEDGAQLAKVGKILGWVGLGLWVLGTIGLVLFFLVFAATASSS